MKENKELWKGIHEKMQKTTKLDIWGVHTRIHPKGVASKASIFTIDGFTNLYDTIKYLRFEEDGPYSKMSVDSKMNEISPEGFGYTVIRERIHWVN